jgi:hypothetical protein
MMVLMAARFLLLALAGALTLAAGCATSAKQDDPTTRALNDPMNYSPHGDEDISGGGLTDFHKDAFNKDMNHVLDP